MSDSTAVLEYKCPCCDAPLKFNDEAQKMRCEFCDNELTIEAVKAYNEPPASDPEVQWQTPDTQWDSQEQESLQVFTCSACGGEIISDENTAATFCPYCENPTILPGRLSGGLKPDFVLPFKTSKEDAKAAFLKMCKGKPLLPKMFTEKHRIEKITGIYVPFWLYDCHCGMDAKFRGTKVRTWSDSRYHYTATSHFLVTRAAEAAFSRIPMDGSKKLDDAIMESIEPFDYSQMVDFDTAYLSGFFADKYDVEVESGHTRIKERAQETIYDTIRASCIGYSSIIPLSQNVHIDHGKAIYVLLPVWMLHTQYEGKTYVFAMNGQTGKMTGTLPICKKRSWSWFSGIAAGTAAVAALIQFLAQM